MRASEAKDMVNNRMRDIEASLIPSIIEDIRSSAKYLWTSVIYSSWFSNWMYLFKSEKDIEYRLQINWYKYVIKGNYLKSISRA